jgi:Immunoglobulin-like domain of bacterial spore germination
VAALLLSGCDALQLGVETPTLAPTATAAAASTASPVAPTQLPATASPAGPTPPPATALPATATVPAGATVAASNTPEALPTNLPTLVNSTAIPGQPQVAEAILILTPGGNSTVSSPVRVSGEADPTFEQNLVVQIADLDGAILATQSTTIQGGSTRGPFDIQVPFTILQAGPGRISVFSTSARDSGLIHLASVDVMLKPGGSVEPVAGQPHDETLVILEPAPLATISGSSLHVSGFSDYVFEGQLALALCREGGSGAPNNICGTTDNLLATGSALINAPDVGQPGPFAGDLPYTVTTTLSARLVVYSRSARDGGIVHLSTVPVQLAP